MCLDQVRTYTAQTPCGPSSAPAKPQCLTSSRASCLHQYCDAQSTCPSWKLVLTDLAAQQMLVKLTPALSACVMETMDSLATTRSVFHYLRNGKVSFQQQKKQKITRGSGFSHLFELFNEQILFPMFYSAGEFLASTFSEDVKCIQFVKTEFQLIPFYLIVSLPIRIYHLNG